MVNQTPDFPAASILIYVYTRQQREKAPTQTSTPRPSIETGGLHLVGLYQCCLPLFRRLGAFVLCGDVGRGLSIALAVTRNSSRLVSGRLCSHCVRCLELAFAGEGLVLISHRFQNGVCRAVLLDHWTHLILSVCIVQEIFEFVNTFH